MKIILSFILFLNFSQKSDIDVELYTILKENKIEAIQTKITQLEKKTKSSQNNVYLSALYIRASEHKIDVKQKITQFKKGVNILEEEIKRYPENIEYRFIRLLIQENTPKILKYNKNIAEDKKVIFNQFNLLNNKLKTQIKNYYPKLSE